MTDAFIDVLRGPFGKRISRLRQLRGGSMAFNQVVAGMLVACVVIACPAKAQDKVGVEVCDTFLAKYETCIGSKVSGAQLTSVRAQVAKMREEWRNRASDAIKRGGLDEMCRQMDANMKKQLANYGCAW